MTRMKKIILSFMMMLLVSVSAFAESGFEANLTVPLGAGIGIQTFDPIKDKLTDEQIKSLKRETDAGFDFGVLAQVGYMIQVADGMGISILGEIGYSRDSFSTKYKRRNQTGASEYTDNKYYTHETTTFDSIQIGLLPKFNMGAFSIGLGGGVKIPLAGTYTETTRIDRSEQGSENAPYAAGSIYKADLKNIKDGFNPTVIPYVKLTADYSIFLTEQFALNLGIYAGYDFGMNYKKYTTDDIKLGNEKIANSYNISSFDIGAQIGLRFGPKA